MIGKPVELICALALVNVALAGNSDPSKAPAICAAQGSDSILVAHEDCSKFYECSEGTPVVLNCPSNLLYNPDREYCDWPQNVNCPKVPVEVDDNEKNEKVNGKGNNDPTKATEICAAQGSDGILVAHEDCRKFYKCSEGKPAALDCPLNLLYNPEKEYCDWPQNVISKIREPEVPVLEVEASNNDNAISGKGNSDPSKAPEICAEKGSDSILVAHEQCNKFYKCSEGKPAVLDCPGNLVYNPEKEYCDWPQNVDCGNRIS